MNLDLLRKVLGIPTKSFREEIIIRFLSEYCTKQGWDVVLDQQTHDGRSVVNVIVTKGCSGAYPTVTAHMDSVQPLRVLNIEQEDFKLVGYNDLGERIGFGADDKAGVFICLQLLHRLPVLKAIFFSAEECGYLGASVLDEAFMSNVGYIVGWDCCWYGLMSYSAGGVQLFDNVGPFIETAMPVLDQHKIVSWQNHPYTDVTGLRRRFPQQCLNLPCGYYNWHMSNEAVSLPDVEQAIDLGTAVIEALGNKFYVNQNVNGAPPPRPIEGLHDPRVPRVPKPFVKVG